MIALYYFLADGPAMVEAVMAVSPLDRRYEHELLQRFAEVSRAVVVATLVAAITQGALAGIGYDFALPPEAPIFLLMALTTVFALIPIFGAFAVWGCVCIWIYLQGDIGPRDRPGDLLHHRRLAHRQHHEAAHPPRPIKTPSAASTPQHSRRHRSFRARSEFWSARCSSRSCKHCSTCSAKNSIRSADPSGRSSKPLAESMVEAIQMATGDNAAATVNSIGRPAPADASHAKTPQQAAKPAPPGRSKRKR